MFEHLTQPENSDIWAWISADAEDEQERILRAGYGFGAGSYSFEVEDGDLAPGDYHVYIASKDKHETEYQKARLLGGGFYYVKITVDENGDITVDGGSGNADGDANGDGEINVADVDFVIESIGEDVETHKSADVNGDGEINVADVDYIIERIM